MAISFPPSPSNGDIYTYNGAKYVYDGVKWVSGGQNNYIVQGEDATLGVTATGDLNAAAGTFSGIINGNGYKQRFNTESSTFGLGIQDRFGFYSYFLVEKDDGTFPYIFDLQGNAKFANNQTQIKNDGGAAFGNGNITLNAAGIITCGTNTPGGGAAGDINCHRMLVGSQSASQQFSIALVPSGTSQYNFAVRDTGLVSVGNALQSNNLNSDNITLQVGGTINALNEVVQPALSERRMKQNIADIDKDIAWNTVRDVPFREFEYRRNPGRKYYGNIVDEVETVEPSLVVPSLLEDDEEGPIRTIDKNKLNGYLAVALQTALTRIEALEARLSTLEGN